MDPLIDLALDAITAEVLQKRLISPGYREDLYVDYKQEFDINSEKHVLKMLQTVSAFANTHGGLLIYGVEELEEGGESTGLPKQLVGFDIKNIDSFKLTVNSFFRAGVDEPIPGLQIHVLEKIGESANRCAFLVRVSPSLGAPHRVDYRGRISFHARSNGGNEPMRTSQIRDSVLKSEGFAERARSFVISREKVIPQSEASIGLHIVPLRRQNGMFDITRSSITDRLRRIGIPQLGGGQSYHKPCLEGFRNYLDMSDGRKSYVLFFRDGSIEVFDNYRLSKRAEGGAFFPIHVEAILVHCLGKLLDLYKEQLLNGPSALMLSIRRIDNFAFKWRDDQFEFGDPKTITGDICPEPELISDGHDDPHELLRPAMHMMWNAAGFERCPGYDASEKWVGYKDKYGDRLRI